MEQITTSSEIEIKVGQRYIVDKDFANGGEIELVAIYGEHFCRVKDPDNGAEWETMCNRLSNI